MFEWGWPWLFALLPLPLLVAWLLPRAHGWGGTLLRLPHPGLALPAQRDISPVAPMRRWLALLGWLLLVAAAARPQWLGPPEDVARSGRDLMLAIDTSGSMSVEDMQLANRVVPRFAAIQAIASDFVQRRAGDRVGLILFGSRAYLLVPLTFDLKTVGQQLLESVIGLAGRETAIGDAVALAVKRLRDRPQQQRVLVLLTDGVNTAGELSPQKATELASAHHVRIYTIGVGAERMRVDSLFGSRLVNPSQDLDEGMLTQMAQATGGRYFRARNSEELADIYREIDKLEPAAEASQSLRPVDELYWMPLAAALLCAVGAFAVPMVGGWRRLGEA